VPARDPVNGLRVMGVEHDLYTEAGSKVLLVKIQVGGAGVELGQLELRLLDCRRPLLIETLVARAGTGLVKPLLECVAKSLAAFRRHWRRLVRQVQQLMFAGVAPNHLCRIHRSSNVSSRQRRTTGDVVELLALLGPLVLLLLRDSFVALPPKNHN